MNNIAIQLKIKQRLNKLASNDFDNLECWQIVEAFNKGSVDWVRRQLHGTNLKKTGDEQSKRRIDDLQILLTEVSIGLINQDKYVVSNGLPENYLEWKRVSAEAKNECCDENQDLVIYLSEEGNVDLLLRDEYKKPNYEWGETFCTLKDGNVRIYTNNAFAVENARLSYYKQPRRIEIVGCVDPYTDVASPIEVESEFKDDIVEILIDEAAKILAGDFESQIQVQINKGSVEENN
tara:strand:- start:10940 stop:11644 length:705 start_codon:yes stop_codon:yes gene_type:complete